MNGVLCRVAASFNKCFQRTVFFTTAFVLFNTNISTRKLPLKQALDCDGGFVKAEEKITIQASIDVVWQTLTDIDSWPRWQNAVTKASLKGPLLPNATFMWTSGGMKISSKIHRLSAPVSIQWMGQTVGTKADHLWSLESTKTGTIVTTVESMEGWLVSLLELFNKNFLINSLRQTLTELKVESERRHAV